MFVGDFKFRTLVYLILCALTSPSFSAMEFPPEIRNEKELWARAREILELLPDASHDESYKLTLSDALTMVRREQELIDELKADPRYMAAIAQRPALQTFRFQRVREASGVGVGLNTSWHEMVNDVRADSQFANLSLSELLTAWKTRSALALFSAFSQKIPKHLQREYLSEPDLMQRWFKLKAKFYAFDLNRIDVSRFNIKKYGFDPIVAQELMNEIDLLERRLIVALNDGRGDAAPWFMTEKAIDAKALPVQFKNLEWQLKDLKKRACKLYTAEEPERGEVVERELVLREAPPYLAIYRGCIGNDCATQRSWAFPYSPDERVWWIEDVSGEKIGYVAGNITRVDGKPNLYIRDVVGRGLRSGDATLIIKAFHQLRKSYGADQMTIAPLDFIKENTREDVRIELRRFHGLAEVRPGFYLQTTPVADDPILEDVEQHFSDERIRLKFLDGRQMHGNYDKPADHAKVRRVSFPDDIELSVRVLNHDGSERPRDPLNSPDDFYTLFRVARANSDFSSLDEFFAARQIPWREIDRAIDNVDKLAVAEYRARINELFARYALPISGKLMRKNEALYLKGFLNAPDAFSGDENTRQSARYLLDMIFRNNQLDKALPYVVAHLDLLEDHELMARNLRSLFDRRKPIDVERIQRLWDAGYRFRSVILNAEDQEWLRSELSKGAARNSDCVLRLTAS